jgi:hypothetical protein
MVVSFNKLENGGLLQKKWQIETLFSSLKLSGLYLEYIHATHLNRLETYFNSDNCFCLVL